MAFEADVFLSTPAQAQLLTRQAEPEATPGAPPAPGSQPVSWPDSGPQPQPAPPSTPRLHAHSLRLVGTIPPEVWNRLGTKILPKLRAGADLQVSVALSVSLTPELAPGLTAELHQILQDLGLDGCLRVEQGAVD